VDLLEDVLDEIDRKEGKYKISDILYEVNGSDQEKQVDTTDTRKNLFSFDLFIQDVGP